MAEIKTKMTKASPEAFLNTIKEEQRRKDAFILLEMMKKATRGEARMWGSAIIGVGDHKYTLSSGKENPWFLQGFAARKKDFALYLMGEKGEKYHALLGKLGKHSISKGCLYINKITDIDTKVLHQILELQVKACKSGT